MIKNICPYQGLVGGSLRLAHKVAVGVFVFKGLYFCDRCLRQPFKIAGAGGVQLREHPCGSADGVQGVQLYLVGSLHITAVQAVVKHFR